MSRLREGEELIGTELVRLLERDALAVSIDKRLVAAHLRIFGEGDELLAWLALTPARARSAARYLNAAADRLDPAGADTDRSAVKLEVVK
jgi:hypothetical protein